MGRVQRLLVAPLVALVLAVGGCGAPAPAGADRGSGSIHAALSVGAEHNGASVQLARGQRLTVTLDSTYWQLSVAQRATALEVVSSTVTPGGPRCAGAVAGSGCGTAAIVVRAVADGTAVVVGRRTACGEALRCAPGQGSYDLTVRVTG